MQTLAIASTSHLGNWRASKMSFFSSSKTDDPLLADFEAESSEKQSQKCCSNCPSGLRLFKWGLTLLSIFCAPIAMFLVTKECGFHLILSCILYILGWVGSVVHALVVIWCTKMVDRNYTPSGGN